MDKIKLSELFEAVLKFKQNPKDTEIANSLENLLNKLVVKTYLNFTEKTVCAVLICNNVWNSDKNAVESAKTLSVNEIMFGLLRYIVNLEDDLTNSIDNEIFCDVLLEMGIVDRIMQYCKTDFDRLVSLIEKAYDFGNIYKIIETSEYFNSDNIQKLTEEIKQTRKELTPDMLKDLKKIANNVDADWTSFKDTVVDDVLDKMKWSKIETSIDKSK